MRRVADNFGLVFTAGVLAKTLGALPSSFNAMESTLAAYRLNLEARGIFQTAADALKALVNDPDTIDLDRSRSLSDKSISAAKAFVRTNRQGVLELLILPSKTREIIPNWYQVRRDDPAVRAMLSSESDHHTVKRRLVAGRKKDRMICLITGVRRKRKTVN